MVPNITLVSKLTLFLVLAAMCRGGETDPVSKELGKGVDLRKINLLGDFQEAESSVFEPLPEKCFKKEKLHYTGSNFDYYASTKAFYSKMALGAGLRFLVGIGLHTGCYTEQCCTKNRVKRISNKWYVLKHPRADR